MPPNREDCIFFWKTNETHGWGSQWYPSPFDAEIVLDGKETVTTAHFPSAEHWMMVQKALLFSDSATARTILASSAGDMRVVKALGRAVANFDEQTWLAHRGDIVLQGNLHKFRQNGELRALLLATGDKLLVEASPMDRIWGIGFAEKNAVKMYERWGLNLLGKALEKTRSILRSEDTV